MNKVLSFAVLCSLMLAPGCRNPICFWRKPKPTRVEKSQERQPVEIERKSGPEGWQIDLEKE